VLDVEKVTLSWEGSPVVEDVSLTVAAGELVCLVGRSGCGKTTLFHGVAGLTEPDGGRVLLHGEDVTGHPGRISYMLQKDLLLPQRTILDNACLPLLVSGMPKAEARSRAAGLFARFGLEGCERQYPCQLSGGMRQRAALLRTYLMDDEMVLLDEPFSALDAITRVDLRGWFLHMMGELGLSVLLVTHDVDEAVSMADRIIVMRGRPSAGEPSHLVGEVRVPCARDEREGFELTDGFLSTKREVLALLG
jgi:ABC-type nitrate/sulfonate/bicarbonate transport system ATPase subunit